MHKTFLTEYAQNLSYKKDIKMQKSTQQKMNIFPKSTHWDPLATSTWANFGDPNLDVYGSILAPKDAQEAPQPLQHAEKKTQENQKEA